MPMLRYTPCTRQPTWAAVAHRLQWRPILYRRYASTGDTDGHDLQWFHDLRAQMLQRSAVHLVEHLTVPHEHMLAQTLRGFLPRECCRPPTHRYRTLPVGHHLIWFNPAPPTGELLPDGTDASHSPGGPWVRRMWAGGSMQLRPDVYFDKTRGFAIDNPMAGIEHIKDVQLRGQGDTAKIFVTIERRFARADTLKERYRITRGSLGRGSGLERIQGYFEDQLRSDDAWGDAILKERRNLVFFKERSTAELDAIKAGQMTSVKYLDPPGKPVYSYTLTPNRNLLFRFSALTFNAHLIHLDPDFARNVEGHRNLLVHGPLSLTLMLQALNHHLETDKKGNEVVESIEYRNLAPLYCDEEMRICGLEKKALENGSVYDVWIEGPTGGAAVKGTVTTVQKPISASAPPQHPKPLTWKEKKLLFRNFREKLAQDDNDIVRKIPKYEKRVVSSAKPKATRTKQATEAATTPRPSEASESEPSVHPEGEKSMNPTINETASQAYSREVISSSISTSNRTIRRNRSTRVRAYRFITPTNTTPPIHRVEPFQRVKPVLSNRSKYLLRRLLREGPPTVSDKPLPLVRRYAASPYISDPDRTASRHSRFHREGVKKIEKPSIRYTGPSLARGHDEPMKY